MFTFGSFRLDPNRRLLEKDGEPVSLPAKAVDTLALLIRERGRVVEKDEILTAVWPDAFVSEDSLTQVISLLRRALGDDSSNPAFIATVPRRGYRFLADITGDAPTETVSPPLAAAPASEPVIEPVAVPAGPRRRLWTPALWAIPAVIVLALIARTVSVAQPGGPTGAPIRFLQQAPPGTMLSSGGVLSPDGRYLAFVAQDIGTGRDQLWLRPLDSPAPRVIAGTDGAYRPFWSPDSRSLAFFSEGRLKRVGIDGLAPRTLANVGYRPDGGSWSSRGVIIYADRISQLYAVPENGGTPTVAMPFDREHGEYQHVAPQFLPDGDHFLFGALSATHEYNGTYIGSLSARTRTRVLDGSAGNVIFAAPGYLLFVRDNLLMAQRFDPETLRVTGAASQVPTINASQDEGEARVGSISASGNGLLVFGGDRPASHLAWFSRDGRENGLVTTAVNLGNPMVAPDERTLVANGGAQGGIWLVDLERGTPTRLVPDGMLGAWSADGASVMYTVRRDPDSEISVRSVTGSEESVLLRTGEMKISGNWSPDGHRFAYASSNPQTRLDLWILEYGDGAATPRPFLKSPANEMQPQISPDGRWIAYASDETGTWEVYVQSFPMPGQKRTLSVGGGAQPEWRRDGRELFYVAPDGALMAIAVRGGAAFEASRPTRLFSLPVAGDVISARNQYAVTSNGQRFIVNVDAERDPIHIVVNWNALVNP